MSMGDNSSQHIARDLEKLEKIVEWFETQDKIDLDLNLKKAKEAAALIRNLKRQASEVENQFKDIKKELEGKVEREST